MNKVDSFEPSAASRIAFGRRLREERERLGMTGADVADALRVSRIHNWEAGATSPTVEHLQSLKTLGFDVSYMLTGVPKISANEQLELLERAFVVIDEHCRVRGYNPPLESRLHSAWELHLEMIELGAAAAERIFQIGYHSNHLLPVFLRLVEEIVY